MNDRFFFFTEIFAKSCRQSHMIPSVQINDVQIKRTNEETLLKFFCGQTIFKIR